MVDKDTLIIFSPTPTVEIKETKTTLTLDSNNIDIITVGTQGPPGPQGPAGSGGGGGPSSSATAGVTMSSGIAVVIINDLLYPADPTNISHGAAVVGVLTQAGLVGTDLNYTGSGVVSGLGSYTTGSKYFVGLSGVLQTNPNVIGALWSKLIGVGQSSSDLLVNMETTFY